MSKIKIITAVENLCQHPYHQSIYKTRQVSYLQTSFERFGGKPLYDIIVVPNKDIKDQYWVVSGMNRFDTLLEMGSTEVEVIVMEISDELSIKKLIVDLNKQRVKDGEELLNEFKHYREFCRQQKGEGSFYKKIGKELGWTFDKVKTYVMLLDFFEGDGEIVMKKLFDNRLNVFKVQKLKKIVEEYPESFNSEQSYDRISDKDFDFNRIDFAIKHLSIDNNADFELMKPYLKKDMDHIQFSELLSKLGRLKLKIQKHDESKVFIPILDDTFTTQNTHIIKGDNQEVTFTNPFRKKIKCLITSPYYGNKRTYGDGSIPEKGHNMDGLECAIDISNTLSRFKEEMEEDGSIYVIIDDFKLKTGEYSCSIEYLVIEMKTRGLYLAGRCPWIKNNPVTKSSAGKEMLRSFEWVYRFVLNPVKYYSNPNMYEEISLKSRKEFEVKQGCTNHSNDGSTTRGGKYVQGHLKVFRNTLDEQTCQNVIRGNAANPEDFFRQVDEKRHTATAPIYLTAALILEGSKEGDLILDCYNGVGNTMTSALLLNRQYIGIEIDDNYYQQTCRRSQITEEMVEENNSELNYSVAA
jgi:DNA modification methylase